MVMYLCSYMNISVMLLNMGYFVAWPGFSQNKNAVGWLNTVYSVITLDGISSQRHNSKQNCMHTCLIFFNKSMSGCWLLCLKGMDNSLVKKKYLDIHSYMDNIVSTSCVLSAALSYVAWHWWGAGLHCM